MHSIKAIETRYKGYRFRSRLEARWAVFFDTMGLRWEYEPEGYVGTGGSCYLPDFRLNGDLYVEIKPEIREQDPDTIPWLKGERIKWGAFLSAAPRERLIVLLGPPGHMRESGVGFEYHADHSLERLVLGECRRCSALSWTYLDETCQLEQGYALGCLPSCTSERAPIVGDRLRAAVAASRAARFDHAGRA